MIRSKSFVGDARWALPLVTIGIVLVLWGIGYAVTAFLPSPLEVLGAVPRFLAQEGLAASIFVTLQRVAAGLLGATVLGLAIILLMELHVGVKRILETYVTMSFGTPSLVAVIVGLMVFGLSDAGVYAAVTVITFPFITAGLMAGRATVEPSLLEMSSVFHLSAYYRYRHIVLPHTVPYFLGSLRNAHALAWKVAVTAEVILGRSGIGGEFSRAYNFFNMVDLLLWLGVFLVSLLVIEYGVLRSWERRLFRWRPAPVSTAR